MPGFTDLPTIECPSCEWLHVEETLDTQVDRAGRKYYICRETRKKVFLSDLSAIQP